MKHVVALVAITIFVFGTIFLFTSGLPFGGPGDEGSGSGEAVMQVAENPPPAAEPEPVAEEPAAPTEETAPAEEPAAPAEEPAGEDAAPAEEPAAPAEGEADVAALVAEGQGTYEQVCQACHGAEGEGSVGPAFAANGNLEDPAYVAQTIIHGREAMPPFGDQFDDGEIAAVATFIRNSWGNEFGAVTADEAAAER